MSRQAIQMHAEDIITETERAMGLFPPIHSAHEGYAVIKEELDEFWEQVVLNPHKLTSDEREARREKMRRELTQTAAMCLRTIADLAL